ncbi:MAG: transglutaminase-like domain-containing protein [Gammaproteobacteria bacterium]
MKRSQTVHIAFVLALAVASRGKCADAVEPLLRDLPAGVVVESSAGIPPTQTKGMEQRLGGKVERITNSKVRVHGRLIQVNVITAEDDASATAILAAVARLKSHPFCMRKGRVVIEYVGKDIDAAIALKTSYELGLQPKPKSVRYQVVAELAAVEKADYMACNPLFNQFLALQSGADPNALQQINDLSRRFAFGRKLVLRNPKLGGAAAHTFQPAPTGDLKETETTIAYSFGRLPERQGVPYVTATLEITADDTGFCESATTPSKALTAATPFWPADHPNVVALARQITAGKTGNDARAAALLEWLSPGRNLKYSGQTGSRWGASKVLEQKFGHCWDFSDCFVTLARAAGVPSRQIAGWLYGSSGHVWAEFYREDKGWQQVDPTGRGELRCGIYHIAYFTSEDGEMPILYVSMPKIESVQPK